MSVYAKVSFEVIRATSLLGMNIGGTSNPFVKVEIGKTNFTTPTIDNTNAPNWREAGHQAQSTFSFPAVHVPTVVTISVFNKLPYGDNLSDFIGQASVTVMKPGENQQTIPLTHGGNMQLANKAPTGCGMIEVSYNAEEVSETEYFDALLGKSSTSTSNPAVVPMATIPDMAGSSTTITNPVAVLDQQQQPQNQMPAAANDSTTSNPIAATADGQQQQPSAAPAATTTTASSVNLTPSTSSVGDASAPPPPAADGDAANNTLPPQQQQQPPQPDATPDVSIVADGQQQQQPTTITSLPQQHQIPALGGGLSNNGDQQQQQLPPLPPTQSGAMPTSLDSFSAMNNNNNNQQQPSNTITVQAPASSNAVPVPQPQAQFGYIPQVQQQQQQQQVMTTGPAPSSSRSNMFSNQNQNTRASSNGRAPSSGRPGSSRPHSAGGNNTSMMMNSTNHNSSVMSHHNKSAMMNHSTIAAAQSNTIMNSSSIFGGGNTNIHRTTKSERLASVAARWFEMIRSGGNTAGNALREIRSSSEKDPSIVLEACDAAGRTLLHEAAYSGTIELFQELLSLAIRAGNTRGTAMSMQLWASEQHNISAWSTVPPDGYQGPKYVTANGGNTVLHTAASAGRSDMVDWMLRQGAVFVAMAQTRNKRGLRPLESAAERGHLETAKILARSTTA